MWNTPLNWVFFGRCAACTAELFWAHQMSWLVGELSRRLSARSRLWRTLSASIFVLACVAEVCSWTNLISENNLFAVLEQALWAILFAVTACGVVALLHPRGLLSAPMAIFALLAALMAIEQGDEAFGLYLGRFLRDQKNHTEYAGFVQGLEKLFSCAEVSTAWEAWEGDAGWMSAYFSLGVWSSIWLGCASLSLSLSLCPRRSAAESSPSTTRCSRRRRKCDLHKI